MSWKKNAFSYLMWLIYSLGTAACVVLLTGIGIGQAYGTALGLFAGGGLLGGAGLAVFLVQKLSAGKKKTAGVPEMAEKEGLLKGGGSSSREMQLLVTESLVAVLLLIAGVWLRAMELPLQESAYFNVARVSVDQSIPQIVHGAVYFYIQLLHLVCLIFGNKIVACVIVQIGLQTAAVLLLYLGLRRMAGQGAAMLALAFLMLSPEMIVRARILSPEVLFLFLFSLVFAFTAGLYEEASCVEFFAAGALSGFIFYLDVTGFILFLFGLSAVYLRREPETERDLEALGVKEKGKRVFLLLFGGLISFVTSIALDSLISGKEMGNVFWAWGQTFAPKQPFSMPEINLSAGALESFILLAGMTVGIFGFWCRKERERLSVWTLALLCLILGNGFFLITPEVPGVLLSYWILAAMAGIGIQEMFAGAIREKPVAATLRAEEDLQADEPLPAEEKKQTGEEDLQIVYIENPLPLPKKHEKKVMDFALKQKDEDDFDFAVSDEDDFDF